MILSTIAQFYAMPEVAPYLSSSEQVVTAVTAALGHDNTSVRATGATAMYNAALAAKAAAQEGKGRLE